MIKFNTKLTAEQLTEGVDLTGQTILLTGCNSGIGFETLRVLALRGARVLSVARTLKKAEEACANIVGDCIPLECDLSKVESIRTLIKGIDEPLSSIICCAGIMALPERQLLHGIEAHMFINHVSHFMLVNGLLNRLTPYGRIIVYSSAAHSYARGKSIHFDDMAWNRPYAKWSAYGYSKLANILFVKALAQRLPKGQTANALHPGIIDSELFRHVPEDRLKYSLKSCAHGANTGLFLATNDTVANVSGQYFSDGKIGIPSVHAQDENLAKELWEVTEGLVRSL